MSTSNAQTRSTHTPELVALNDTISQGSPGLLYRAESDGAFYQRRWTGTGWAAATAMTTDASPFKKIFGAQAPAAKSWEDIQAAAAWTLNERRTIAVLPTDTFGLRVYTLNVSTGRWNVLFADSSRRTEGKPFIEYRPIRNLFGQTDSLYTGHFMFGLSTLDPNANPPSTVAKVRISTLVGRNTPPTPGTFGTLTAGDFLHDPWSLDRMGSASSLYSDATIDNVFGLVPLWIPGDGLKGVYFYPHADGSPNHSYGAFSDFRVMEDLVCGRLQAVGGVECGTVDVKN